MNKKEDYKIISKGKMFQFILFYMLLASSLILYSSFAKYTTVVEDQPEITIASWNIKINDIDINGEPVTNMLTIIPNIEKQTTTDNKLAPGQNGYFYIIIDPTGTDVAIEYTITFNTDNLPDGFNFTTYEVGDVSNDIVNNEISDTISLNDETLTQENKKQIKVNWKWDENSEIPDEKGSYYVSATIAVKQKID